MIDPSDPLAHLYGDLVDDPTPDAPEVLRTTKTTVDDLNLDGPEVEEISDSDVDELALLVKDRHAAGTSSDEFLADLGLGDFVPLDDGTFDLHLNAVGLAVTRRLAEWEGLVPPATATG